MYFQNGKEGWVLYQEKKMHMKLTVRFLKVENLHLLFCLLPGDKTQVLAHVCIMSFISWKRSHISVPIGHLISSPCLGRLLPIIMCSLS